MNLEKVLIESKVDEVFAKTIVNQELMNYSNHPAEFSVITIIIIKIFYFLHLMFK